MLDPRLLEILVCPRCKGAVALTEDELHCSTCQLAYPIRDEIPVMLVTEARPLA